MQDILLRSNFDNFSQLTPPNKTAKHLLVLQPNLFQALENFVEVKNTKTLVVNTPDLAIYRQIIQETINSDITRAPCKVLENITLEKLVGYISISDNVTRSQSIHPGILSELNNGFLILSINSILSSPLLWSTLKEILHTKKYSYTYKKFLHLKRKAPRQECNFKLILTGDHEQIATLMNQEPDLYTGLAQYAEFETELKLNNTNFNQWQEFVNAICKRFELPFLKNHAAYTFLAQYATRITEEQYLVPLTIAWYQQLLSVAELYAEELLLDANALKFAINAKEQREGYFARKALNDIKQGQVLIDCKGKEVGQINGLTVIDVAGHPMAYGEPTRISCVVHVGDGDVSDVERKVDLGGNIHAKGMMIMQAFISSALNLDEPLPYSASIAFEQSYCEVDGDSASLAELCTFVSALSKQALNQEIAVTGAVDQFGRVQAVGGINTKIESFFRVCEFHGLTGNQGVILPKSNEINLCLHEDLILALKEKRFNIWLIDSVDEAFELLTGIPFYGEKSHLYLIDQRIKNDYEKHHQGFFARLLAGRTRE